MTPPAIAAFSHRRRPISTAPVRDRPVPMKRSAIDVVKFSASSRRLARSLESLTALARMTLSLAHDID
jgi:hypothetical protein